MASILNRRQIRIKVLQAYYAQQTSGNSVDDTFKLLLQDDYMALKKGKDSQAQAGEDDAHFLSSLFFGSLNNAEAYDGLLKAHLQNWDLGRIAMLDRLILHMGIHEMLTFEDIPVKVSINEYIEIARQYSTEKSGQFVNGVLDAAYAQLKADNKIVKTGRGLLDASSYDTGKA